jgi:hypothetical protein
MRATKQDIKSVVYSGCAIELDGVSICKMENFLKHAIVKRVGKYQVWSDKHQCYDIFHNVDDAVSKFFQLTGDKLNG